MYLKNCHSQRKHNYTMPHGIIVLMNPSLVTAIKNCNQAARIVPLHYYKSNSQFPTSTIMISTATMTAPNNITSNVILLSPPPPLLSQKHGVYHHRSILHVHYSQQMEHNSNDNVLMRNSLPKENVLEKLPQKEKTP